MFPVDPGLITLVNSPAYNVHKKVWAQRAGEVFAEATEITSRVVSGTISASMDDRARRLRLTLQRGAGTDSLSPLFTTSTWNDPTPLLQEGGRITLQIAVTAPGVVPDPGDYIDWDRFRIDSWNAADGPNITVTGRDWGSALFLDTMIEGIDVYAADLAEVVMQQLKAAAGGITGATTIALPDGSPGVTLNETPFGEIKLDDALVTIALLFGWDIRNFPSDLETVHRLYDPGRARTVADATIPLSTYTRIEELASSDADVRNAWSAVYDKAGSRLEVTAEDATSIAKYGRRFARIHESQTSPIDTEPELQAMADAALADTKDPYASHRVSLLLWPWVELNDLHAYPANASHYNAEQKFAIVGYSHDFHVAGGRTTLQVRGKPIAAYRRWRAGYEPPIIVSDQDPPAGGYAKEGTIWAKVATL